MDVEKVDEQIARSKAQEAGVPYQEYERQMRQRQHERWAWANYERMDELLAEWLTQELAANPGVDLAEFAAAIKADDAAFPLQAEIHAEVDAWFAGPECAGLVEAARNRVSEPGPEPVFGSLKP
jgi:hypothetical protein